MAGGCFADTGEAQAKMCGLKQTAYTPIPENVRAYNRLFSLYRRLHNSFGSKEDPGNLFIVMKELLDIKRSAV